MGRHINIELLTLSEVTAVSGQVGDFHVRVKQHPRYVDMDKCIACGLCAEKCPKKVDNEFDGGLGKRKAAYVKFSQAVPLKYCLDEKNCIYLTKGKCRACEKFCPTGAINFEDKEKELELEVGAIVLAAGAECYDPARQDTFGYTLNKNVLTSLEFERMLSASGPFGGHLRRMSDGAEPRKIAFLQCVGSRSQHEQAASYCSAVCCSYAVKEAVIAKEHAGGELDTAIFFIDLRTQGKEVEQYYNRAQQQGVRFIKSRIATLEPGSDGHRVGVRYTDAAGRNRLEEFDLVVLSVGFVLSAQAKEQLALLGVPTRPDGLPVVDSFQPVTTGRDGVMVCGTLQAPKDIPFSVMDASACAGQVSALLREARGSLARHEEKTPEEDVNGEPPRVGVFVCHCGTNIAGVVDCPSVAEYARSLPGVAFVMENMFSCSQDAQEKITQAIKENRLNRVVVAACTPRTHEPLFQQTLIKAGLNKYLFEMANIRNQCSWVHSKEKDKATVKAKDLVRMAVAKAVRLRPLEEQELPINRSALVVGGGLAGLTAALSLAEQGFEAVLVEREKELGGNARHLARSFAGEDVPAALASLIERVGGHPKVRVFTGAEVAAVEGFVGNYRTTVQTAGGEEVIEHGAVIIASGAREFRSDDYLLGRDPRVMTGLEMEARLLQGEQPPAGPVAFLQCVGSRDEKRPWCSKVCCSQSVNAALRLKEQDPSRPVYVIYRQMRTYGLREELYRRAREAGVHFIRYRREDGFAVHPGEEALELEFTDRSLDQRLRVKVGSLVLASAVVPPEDDRLAKLFKVTQNQDGFFQEAHAKLRPVEFATDGVFLCGLAHSPMPMEEATASAQAAAAKAAALLSNTTMLVGGSVSVIDQSRCVSCGVCIEVCPYQAITWDENGKAVVNPATCKGCGLCQASCRSHAPSLLGFDDAAILAQIDNL